MTGKGAGDDDAHDSASSSCFPHEVAAGLDGSAPASDDRQAILRWRKAERERLIAERLAMPADDRRDAAARIAARLDTLLPDLAGRTVSLYWPLRGEPDLRDWLGTVTDRGARCALPLVLEKHAPMVFRTWQPGEPLVRGFWNIPVPTGG